MAKRTTKKVDFDFPCFSQLHDCYRLNRGHIRSHYRKLSRKFLDFNDPDHNPSGASSLRLGLRPAQPERISPAHPEPVEASCSLSATLKLKIDRPLGSSADNPSLKPWKCPSSKGIVPEKRS